MFQTLSAKVPCVESIRFELNRWNRLHVDIMKLKSREGELVNEVHLLKDKVKLLERKLQVCIKITVSFNVKLSLYDHLT